MSKNQEAVNKSFGVKNVYELLLCLYIIIAPIINSISDISVFGYGFHIIIVVGLLIMTVVTHMFSPTIQKHAIGYPIILLTVFIVEVIIGVVFGSTPEIGLVLLIFLYCAFLIIPNGISMRNIYIAFYVSALVAAIYSIILGATEGAISRTATMVDGSIAIITILLVFWGEESFKKTVGYDVLKYIAMFSCFVVAFFGMSRARLFILVGVVGIKILFMFKNLFVKRKIKVVSLFLFIIILFALFVLSRLNIIHSLFDAIFERFSGGFVSLGRDEEIRVGWQYFMNSPLLGEGWGKMQFVDYHDSLSHYSNHCMYVAILARGGIVMGLAFLISFTSIIWNVIQQKKFLGYIMLVVFFLLGYGNAGVFSYTICSFMIPIVIQMKEQKQ